MMKRIKLLSTYLVLTTLLLGCKKEGPIESVGNGKPPGYYLFVGNWAWDEIYIVDTDSNFVVDTMYGFKINICEIVVTLNGRKMYVTTQGDSRYPFSAVYVADLNRRSVRQILDKVADIYLAPNGTVFVITSYRYYGVSQIGIIDAIRDRIIFFDTLNIQDTNLGYDYQNVAFDVNRNLLYGINREHQLFAYNYVQKKVVRIYKNAYGFYFLQMLTSHDGKYLYVAGGPVFDLEHDSVIAYVGKNYLGSLALSPDGEYLYITDPGKYLNLEILPTGKVYIYQIKTYSYIGEIDVIKASDEYKTSYATDHISLMPDGKTAYVTNWSNALFVMDLQNREVKKVIKFPRALEVSMSLGLKLK